MDPAEQQKVRRNAASLDPRFVVSDNPDAINGPPIVTDAGVVLGGNSRAMSIQLAYDGGDAATYREALRQKAVLFGLEPEAVDGFERPVLVRVVEGDMDAQTMARRARLYNQAFTQGLDAKAEGVSRGRMVSERSMGILAQALEGHATLREYLNQPGSRKLIESLEADGVLEASQRGRILNKETGLLSDEGKRQVELALRGRVVDDFDLLDAAPAPALSKIDRVLPAVAKVQVRGDEWDISDKLKHALRQIVRMRAQGMADLRQYFATGSLLEDDTSKGDRYVVRLAYALDGMKPTAFKAAWDRYAKDAVASVRGQGRLPGVETPTAEESFEREFGDKKKRFSRRHWDPAAGKGIGAQRVRRAVDALQARAVNALPLEVVQSVSDLPEDIQVKARRERGSGLVEAVYDGEAGTTYFIAENIASENRAVALWLHEQGLHHGLRGLFPDAGQLRRMLNAVARSTPRDAMRSILQERGLENTPSGRREAAEEHLARIAERVSLGDVLTQREKSLWQRVKAALKRAVRALVGRRRMTLSEGEMGQIVADAVRWTVHGPREAMGMSGAHRFSRSFEAEDFVFHVTEDEGSTFWETAKEMRQVRLLKEKDIGVLERVIRQPYWIAKDHPQFRTFMHIELKREEARTEALLRSWGEVKEHFDGLSARERKLLTKVIWSIEGKKLEGITEKRSVVVGKDERGHNIRRENIKHYIQLGQVLLNRGVPMKIAKAVVVIRRSLDNDVRKVYDRLRTMREMQAHPGEIERYRTSMGRIHNYFPHIRRGTHYIKATDPRTGDTLYREHFFGGTLGDMKAARLMKGIRKQFPDAKWDYGKVQGLPEDVYDHSIPVDAMEQVIGTAVKRSGKDPAEQRQLRDLLHRSVSDVLKTRGWGRHAVKRQDIPGFEKDDIERILWEHKSGLYGWLSKMDAARAFTDALYNIDAAKQPRLYGYAARYVQDMLQNSDRVDHIIQGVKSLIFLKYLGYNLKTATLNFTQNMVAGVPRLSADTSFATAHSYFTSAMDYVVKEVGRAGALKQDERKLLEDLYYTGITNDLMMRELRGQVAGKAYGLYGKIVQTAGLPMSVAERFNRCSLALAAYRIARDGKVRAKDVLEAAGYKKGQKWRYEDAREYAETVVLDSHFLYGKSNRPELFRGGTGNKFLSTAYTFRTFTHGLLSLWRNLLMKKGWRGKRAVAMSLGATALFGGVTALPLYKMFASIVRQFFGEDPTEMVRSYFESPEARDAATYGVPALLGVNLSGSLGMELPVFERIEYDQQLTDQVLDNSLEILGVPVALIEDIGLAAGYLRQGNTGRALEEILPAGLANILKAHRLTTKGAYTRSGRPIALPGETEAHRLTAEEAIAQAIGFQPLSRTKSWDAYSIAEDLKNFRQSKQKQLVYDYLQAVRSGDEKARRKAMRERLKWNKRMHEAGKEQFMIKPLPGLVRGKLSRNAQH
ncbi:hypothetical protein JCM16814_16400 [Desulfobaculum senezii]